MHDCYHVCTDGTATHATVALSQDNFKPNFHSFFLQISWKLQHILPRSQESLENVPGVNILFFFFFFTSQMSWRPTYRGSKFRNVYGKVANREQSFEGIPITKNVHDSHFCAVNSKFVAVVTESAGGGSFIVIPVSQVIKEPRIIHRLTHCN